MSTQNTETKPDPSIGAIWKKQSAKGNTFYTGEIEINGAKHSFVMFQNDRKPEGSNQPDWRIFKSNRPDNRVGTTAAAPQKAAPVAPPARPVGRPAPARPVAQPTPEPPVETTL